MITIEAILWACLCFTVLGAESCWAQTPVHQDISHEEVGGHHVALFLGNTNRGATNAFSLGIDYNYRWHPNLAVGVLVDHASGRLDETLLAATASFHPIPPLEVLLGAGPELTEEGTEFAFRIGVLHEFTLGPITLAPVINLDLVNGEKVWVFGITVGRWFEKAHVE